MMPQIFFSALYVMCGQLLNAHESFGPYQWAPVINNLVAIIGAGIFLGVWGTGGPPADWPRPRVGARAPTKGGGWASQGWFRSGYGRTRDLRRRPRWGCQGLGGGRLGGTGRG